MTTEEFKLGWLPQTRVSVEWNVDGQNSKFPGSISSEPGKYREGEYLYLIEYDNDNALWTSPNQHVNNWTYENTVDFQVWPFEFEITVLTSNLNWEMHKLEKHINETAGTTVSTATFKTHVKGKATISKATINLPVKCWQVPGSNKICLNHYKVPFYVFLIDGTKHIPMDELPTLEFFQENFERIFISSDKSFNPSKLVKKVWDVERWDAEQSCIRKSPKYSVANVLHTPIEMRPGNIYKDNTKGTIHYQTNGEIQLFLENRPVEGGKFDDFEDFIKSQGKGYLKNVELVGPTPIEMHPGNIYKDNAPGTIHYQANGEIQLFLDNNPVEGGKFDDFDDFIRTQIEGYLKNVELVGKIEQKLNEPTYNTIENMKERLKEMEKLIKSMQNEIDNLKQCNNAHVQEGKKKIEQIF